MTSNNGFNPVNLKRTLGPEDQVKPVAIKKRKPTPENEKLPPVEVSQKIRIPLPSEKVTSETNKHPNDEMGQKEIGSQAGSFNHKELSDASIPFSSPSSTTITPGVPRNLRHTDIHSREEFPKNRKLSVPFIANYKIPVPSSTTTTTTTTTAIRPKFPSDDPLQTNDTQNARSCNTQTPMLAPTQDPRGLVLDSDTSATSSRALCHEIRRTSSKRTHRSSIVKSPSDDVTQDTERPASKVEIEMNAAPSSGADLLWVNHYNTPQRSKEGREIVRKRARQHAWDRKKEQEAAAGISNPPKPKRQRKQKSPPKTIKLESLAPAIDDRNPAAVPTTPKYGKIKKSSNTTFNSKIPPEHLTGSKQVNTPSSVVHSVFTPSSPTLSLSKPSPLDTLSLEYTSSSSLSPFTPSFSWVINAATESSNIRPSMTDNKNHQALLNELPEDVVEVVQAAIASLEYQVVHPMRIKSVHSDPFNSYCIQLSPRMHHLMHFSRGVSNIYFETEHQEDLFHMSQSPALIYATLAWITAVVASSECVPSYDSVYLLDKSVKAINRDFAASANSQISDGTIAAVACIMNLTAINGDRTRANMHMNGLESMIFSRGGLQVVGKNPHLRRLILWADVLCATRWETNPRFELKDVPHLHQLEDLDRFIPAELKDHTFTVPPILANIYRDTDNMGIIPIQFYLYNLAEFLDIVPATDPSLLHRSCYSDHVYVVEHKILQFLRGGTLDRHPILLPLMHSFLLWLYTNIRLTPRGGQIRLILVARLKTYIGRLNLGNVNHSNPNELRWMLFLGGASSCKGGNHREWFVSTMSEIGPAAWWQDGWSTISWMLKGFEKTFLDECYEFWTEVEEIDCKKVS